VGRIREKTILVLDDDKDLNELICDVFKGINYRVIAAESAEKALKLIKSEIIDLLVIDIALPGHSGIEFLDLVRKQNNKVTSVFISGYWTQESLKEAWELGAFECFQKPFNVERLVSAVNIAIGTGAWGDSQKNLSDSDLSGQKKRKSSEPVKLEYENSFLEDLEEKSGCILIVDDNKGLQATLGSKLAEDGYRCLFADNGREALRYLSGSNKIDLILLDLYMPGGSGLEFLQNVHVMPKFNKVPIILMTGTAMPHVVESCKKLGVRSYLTKPTSYKDILSRVQVLTRRLS